jgi:hypothetical protein
MPKYNVVVQVEFDYETWAETEQEAAETGKYWMDYSWYSELKSITTAKVADDE